MYCNICLITKQIVSAFNFQQSPGQLLQVDYLYLRMPLGTYDLKK